ncbi:MAG: DUF3035 domain-containing protein [Alphaproteobacteria bacterium]
MRHRGTGRAPRVAATLLVAGGLMLGLNACEGIKQSLGLSKSAPDEFAVAPNLPLTVPPDFELRPPGTATAGSQEIPVRQKAATDVFGSGSGASDGASEAGFGQGEAAILRAAGAESVTPDIRDTIDREFSIYAKTDQSFLEDLIFWREAPEPGEPLDAEAEAKRLRENAALGKPVTEGETPVIERREKGMLEGIF